MSVPTLKDVLWRAAGIQAVLVVLVFVALLVAPLPDDFFRTYGVITGPAAWIVCSIITAAILRLGATTAVFASVVGGGLGGLAGVLFTHTIGIVAAIVIFGAICEARSPEVPE